LATEPERSAGKQLRWCSSSGFLITQPEILGRDFVQWNISLAKLSEKTEGSLAQVNAKQPMAYNDAWPIGAALKVHNA